MAARRATTVAVVGGGVVGCAIARRLARGGVACTLLERSQSLGAGASSGNSGIMCTGYDAPAGSLEQQCIRRGAEPLRRFLTAAGVPYAPTGSLVVAWTPDECDKLDATVALNHDIGDTDVRRLSREELRAAEPNVSAAALGAVRVTGETLLDPWLLVQAYAADASAAGAQFVVGTEVTSADRAGDHWALGCSDGSTVEADWVVNAAGLWGDELERLARGANGASFTITPRRGDFLVYPHPGVGTPDQLLTAPIQPVPTEFSKGVFVFPTVYGSIMVGPTAEDTCNKVVPPLKPDDDVLAMLQRTAERVVPGLRGVEPLASYSGLRPATEHRDYVIESTPQEGWITVGGIRSTGVTASSGIAEYVWDHLAKAGGVSGDTHNVPLPDEPWINLGMLLSSDNEFPWEFAPQQEVQHPLSGWGWVHPHSSDLQLHRDTVFELAC